jgi:hypothetical protein
MAAKSDRVRKLTKRVVDSALPSASRYLSGMPILPDLAFASSRVGARALLRGIALAVAAPGDLVKKRSAGSAP